MGGRPKCTANAKKGMLHARVNACGARVLRHTAPRRAPAQQALNVGVHAHADAAPDEQVWDVAQAAVTDGAHALEAEETVVAHQPLVPRICARAGDTVIRCDAHNPPEAAEPP